MSRPRSRPMSWVLAWFALAVPLGCSDEIVSLDPPETTPVVDADGDGFSIEDGDCDDSDGEVHPDAAEQCDEVDHDCDGEAHDDGDGDGHDVCDDCDDTDATVHPGATELCNGVEDDCDGDASGEEDADGDAFPLCHGDCDDGDPSVNPGVDDTPYDGVDNDCDGADLLDVDGDGYEWDGAGGEDCDDEEPTTYPGAHESPGDGADSNCDGLDDPVLGENCLEDDTTIDVPGLLEAQNLSYSDAHGGPAGQGFYYDDVEFQGQAGVQIEIILFEEGYWMDPYLYVLDAYCQVIAEDDNSYGNDDAYILLDVPDDGIYTVVVTTADAWEIGEYSLEILTP